MTLCTPAAEAEAEEEEGGGGENKRSGVVKAGSNMVWRREREREKEKNAGKGDEEDVMNGRGGGENDRSRGPALELCYSGNPRSASARLRGRVRGSCARISFVGRSRCLG